MKFHNFYEDDDFDSCKKPKIKIKKMKEGKGPRIKTKRNKSNKFD
jgi:hypothetical protein